MLKYNSWRSHLRNGWVYVATTYPSHTCEAHTCMAHLYTWHIRNVKLFNMEEGGGGFTFATTMRQNLLNPGSCFTLLLILGV